MAYYSPGNILQAIYDFNDRSQKFGKRDYYPTHSASFLILLTAYYSGDITFLGQALNDQRIFRESTSYHNLVSSCLRVVPQQGHLRVLQYLLGAGFDVNHIGNSHRSAIFMAARESNQLMLEILLRPEYGLKRSGDQYKFALQAAADHHDSTRRLENVKTLYLAAESLDQPRTREHLLFRACRMDDLALARWLVADGPVDMYGVIPMVPFRTWSMLHWLAAQGKTEWLQWMLQVQPPRIAENTRHKQILYAAIGSAASGNHLETFLELGKFSSHRSTQLCLLAAGVEDGLAQLSARFTSLDIQSALSQEYTGRLVPASEVNVGSGALWKAISKGRTSNVRLLLERGVRTSSRVSITRDQYEKDQTSFSAIQIMLMDYGNPMFTISDPSKARRGPIFGAPARSSVNAESTNQQNQLPLVS